MPGQHITPFATVPIVRFVSGCTRWPDTCVWESVGHATVDLADYEDAARHRWILIPKPGKLGYARRHEGGRANSKAIYMHREIWERHNGPIPNGMTVDHKNQNTWDNRLSNLRLATISQQGFNKGVQANNSSGFRGVHWFTRMGKYKATIRCKPKRIHLGYFDTAIEAAKAYNRAAIELHGPFACLNEIQDEGNA